MSGEKEFALYQMVKERHLAVTGDGIPSDMVFSIPPDLVSSYENQLLEVAKAELLILNHIEPELNQLIAVHPHNRETSRRRSRALRLKARIGELRAMLTEAGKSNG